MSEVPLRRKRHTMVFTMTTSKECRYRGTAVMMITNDTIVLSSGGWRTQTTKSRINQMARECGIDMYVFQKDFTWFVRYKNILRPFEDGMVIQRNERKEENV